MWRTFLVILAGGVSACAGPRLSVYEPTSNAGALISGHPAAVYPLAGGDVRVASFGTTEVTPRGEPRSVRVLQARMVVTNASDPATWLFDTRNVTAVIPNQGESRAAFVNTDESTLPIVEVHRGETKLVDFYYPMPSGVTSPEYFDLRWRVDTGRRSVAMRTTLEHRIVEPDYTREDVGTEAALGWGTTWWWDPQYPQYAFAHPGYQPQGFGRPVAIARPPTVRVR